MSSLNAGVKTATQQAQIAFQHAIKVLMDQELDGPVALSLIEYTTGSMDLRLVLNMTDEEIDLLYYYTQELDTSSPPSKDDDAKPKTVMVKRDLGIGYKRLVKVFTSFHKYLEGEGAEIYFDWSNIDVDTFNHYRFKIYDGNVTKTAPSRLVKPDVKSEDFKSNTTTKQTEVEQFKKSIKRDKSGFTVLKDKKQFKSWHRIS